jgi:hypothetical protein
MKEKNPVEEIMKMEITPEMVDAAMNNAVFDANAVMVSMKDIGPDDQKAVIEMVTALHDCHKKMTKYSTGKSDNPRIIAQAFQSVIISMVDALPQGSDVLANLAIASFKASSVGGLMGMLKGMIEPLQGKEVPLNDDKE